MRRFNLVAAAMLALVLGACGFIETGHVGVETRFGKVSAEELQPGFYTAVFSSVKHCVVKETSIDLENMTPKAKDRLLLADLDVSIYYTVAATACADLMIQYGGQTHYDQGFYWPARGLVLRLANSAAQHAVSQHDSMVMHTQREVLEHDIREQLQADLDTANKGVFVITRVIIKNIKTDPTVEASIQNAVNAQNKLEQAGIQVEIAKKSAEAQIASARGVAESNRIINGTLTREYLQHESNQALHKFAESGTAHTVVIPANMSNAIINLPTTK